MITEYLLVLGIGHLLGDFYFQTEKIAEKKKSRFTFVLLHSLEYFGAMLLVILPVFGTDMLLAAAYASAAHMLIDIGKFILIRARATGKKKQWNSGVTMLVDQLAHVLSLLVLVYFMCEFNFVCKWTNVADKVITTFGFDMETVARWFMVILVIFEPSKLFIQGLLDDYRPRNKSEAIIQKDNKAGRWIGVAERIIMLVFLALNQYAALGFILTAKSITRYNKIVEDRTFAEYYLLGTLTSTICVVAAKILILGL